MDSKSNGSSFDNSGKPNWLEIVRQQVNSLQFGVVEIVVHDSRVVQIERTERVRLDKTQPDVRREGAE